MRSCLTSQLTKVNRGSSDIQSPATSVCPRRYETYGMCVTCVCVGDSKERGRGYGLSRTVDVGPETHRVLQKTIRSVSMGEKSKQGNFPTLPTTVTHAQMQPLVYLCRSVYMCVCLFARVHARVVSVCVTENDFTLSHSEVSNTGRVFRPRTPGRNHRIHTHTHPAHVLDI